MEYTDGGNGGICCWKGVLNDTCSDVHIVNEMDVPVLAMGLHDVVISASPDGILVSDKEQSSYIKPYVDKFEQQIMFAENHGEVSGYLMWKGLQ